MPDDASEQLDDLGELQLFPAPDIGKGDPGFDGLPARWVWAAMEPAERRARIRELAQWADWLIAELALHNTIPPCWYRHPPVREHLTALYAGWVRIYCAADDSSSRDLGEAEWLATLHNFRPYLSVPTCMTGRHEEPPPRPPAREDAETALAEYLWTSDFGTHPADHPSPEAALRLRPAEEQL